RRSLASSSTISTVATLAASLPHRMRGAGDPLGRRRAYCRGTQHQRRGRIGMKNHFVVALALASAAVLAVLAGGAGARATDDIFSIHALVSDGATTAAPGRDASLVNGWGLSAGPTTPWWAANNGTNTSTLYSGV